MVAKLSERQVLLVKNESVYGQDPTPTASANAIPIMEKAMIEIDVDTIERKHPFPQRGKVKPLAGKKSAKMSFKVEYFGSGTAITPARVGDLLEMCGFGETVGASYVDYTPIAASMKSNTIYSYLDGLLYKILGAVSNLKIDGKSGRPVEFQFDAVGLYQDDTDSAIISPTFETNYKIPPQLLSVTFTLDSLTTFVLREFNIYMGIPIINREDMAGVHGFAGFMVGKQNPTGNLIIEGTTKATYDFLDKFENATEVAASIVVGATGGNKLTITLPAINFTNVKISDSDGLVTFELPISLNLNSGNGSDITIRTW